MEIPQQIDQVDFRLWLQSQLLEKCKLNPQFSLRAFSLVVEVDASSLSKILSGKRRPTKKIISKICNNLSVNPGLIDIFIKSTAKSSTVSTVSTASTSENSSYALIAQDVFLYMSNWYYPAILELTYTKEFLEDPKWLSQTLSVSVSEVKIAIETMLRLGLLGRSEGKLFKTDRHLTNFNEGFTSGANKEYQKQIISKALEAVDITPQDEKDITSMTMAIDVNKIDQARARIKKFRRDMCEFLEDGDQTQVYNLGIQLYPVSKNIKEKL